MKIQATNHKLKTKSGFTLVETLVAITILLIGVLGPITVATRGITDGLYAQNQLIATHLAQEGLDLLSAQIQNNYENGDTFLDGLNNCLSSPYCAAGDLAVSGPITFPSCSSVSDCKIAYDSNSHFYKQYDTNNTTANFVGPVFTRTLVVEIPTPIEVSLKSTVTWTNKTNPQSIVLYRYAFDRNQ